MFYVSKALIAAETRYMKIEKLILALIVASKKLRPYFQAHTIIVVTEFPLRSILYNPNLSERVSKWAVELGQYDNRFQPQRAIKAQILADFIAEFTPMDSQMRNNGKIEEDGFIWKLYVDGSSNRNNVGEE